MLTAGMVAAAPGVGAAPGWRVAGASWGTRAGVGDVWGVSRSPCLLPARKWVVQVGARPPHAAAVYVVVCACHSAGSPTTRDCRETVAWRVFIAAVRWRLCVSLRAAVDHSSASLTFIFLYSLKNRTACRAARTIPIKKYGVRNKKEEVTASHVNMPCTHTRTQNETQAKKPIQGYTRPGRCQQATVLTVFLPRLAPRRHPPRAAARPCSSPPAAAPTSACTRSSARATAAPGGCPAPPPSRRA